ncbi:MAG: hypothetical protein AB8B53_09240 [Flavobacteriales bacterium]
MKQIAQAVIFILSAFISNSQTFQEGELPDKFKDLENNLEVSHFPETVNASLDSKEPGTYIWKHNTSILSLSKDLSITEGGAYIYYNNQWNKRVQMSAKEFSKLFNIPKGILKAGQPYTFVENWRRDSRLLAGWAFWYVLAEDKEGNVYFGMKYLETTETLNN